MALLRATPDVSGFGLPFASRSALLPGRVLSAVPQEASIPLVRFPIDGDADQPVIARPAPRRPRPGYNRSNRRGHRAGAAQ